MGSILNETVVETTYQLFIDQLAFDTLNLNHMLVIHGPKYMHQATVMRKKRRLTIDFREMRSESIVNKWRP